MQQVGYASKCTAMPQQPVKLQLLIQRPWRNPEGIRRILEQLPALGIQPTAAGAATISAQATPQDFKHLFHLKAETVAPRPAGPMDFGRSGGHTAPELPVPPGLEEYIESISVAPLHTRLESSTGERGKP